MKKHIILVLMLIGGVLLLGSCRNYIIMVPGEWPEKPDTGIAAEVITDEAALRSFMASDTIDKAVLNLSLDITEGTYPIPINGSKEISGVLSINTDTLAATDALTLSEPSADTPRAVFEIINNAFLSAIDTEITVTAAAESEIDTIFSMGDARIAFDGYKLKASEESSISSLYIGEVTLSENITIADSELGNIHVSAENDSVLEYLTETNPEITVKTDYDASSAMEFLSQLSAYGKARLTEDITIDSSIFNNSTISEEWEYKSGLKLSRPYVIDLNGNTLASTLRWHLSGGQPDEAKPNDPSYNVTIKNGTIDIQTGIELTNSNAGAICLYSYSCLILDHVTYTTDTTGIVLEGSNNNMKLDIIASDIETEGFYVISTNASAPASSNVEISISDFSALKSSNYFSSMGILFNIPGSLDISDTTIESLSQTVIARGGTHNYRNCTFISTGENQFTSASDFSSTEWKDGNSVPLAALVIGNRNTSAYQYPTEMFLDDVTIIAPAESNPSSGNPLAYHGIFIWQNDTANTVEVRGTVIEGSESAAVPFMNTDMNGADITGLKITYSE